MQGLQALLDMIPYKREGAAVVAFLVLVLQGWNDLVPELGHGPCVVDAAVECAVDWTLKIPDTINSLLIALGFAGVAAGKEKDKKAIIAAVKAGE